MEDILQLLETAKFAALSAGRVVMNVYKSADLKTAMKPGQMPITRADRLSHAVITKHLERTALPVLSEEGRDINISERSSWPYFWLIDPLDGTKEFINKNGEFTVNIALVLNNKPVAGIIYAPCSDTLYAGCEHTGVWKYENGNIIKLTPLPARRQFQDLLRKSTITIVSSRSHATDDTREFINRFSGVSLITMGSSLKFMLLLENKADVYPRFGQTMEWDTAAAHAILNASNRGIYQIDLQSELSYNKADLTNPFFVAY